MVELFVVVHKQDEFAFGCLDSMISKITCISADHRLFSITLSTEWWIQIGDIVDVVMWPKFPFFRQMFIYYKNNFKILEGLSYQTFGDILHVLIAPGRDDDTEFHRKENR